jgi:hypothetical protein
VTLQPLLQLRSRRVFNGSERLLHSRDEEVRFQDLIQHRINQKYQLLPAQNRMLVALDGEDAQLVRKRVTPL